MLARALAVMLQSLGLETALYFLHSLRKGGVTAAYRAEIDQLDIKWHRLWFSEAFWSYITAPCVSTSPVASALARASEATL